MLTDTKRNGVVYTFGYDALNRLTSKAASGITTVNYGYDLLSRPTLVAQSETVSAVYDDLSRVTSQTRTAGSDSKTVSYQYDLAGNRTRTTYPDVSPNQFYVTYEYDNAGELTAMRQKGDTAGVNQLVGVVYNELGQRSTLTQGTSKTVSYGYDSLYRLHTLGIDLANASADLNLTFGYNAAGQITSRTADNDVYAQAAPGGQIAGTYAPDILNRYTKVAGVNQTYDPKGNLTADGTNSFTYDNENRLTKIGTATTLTYDPSDRLSRKAGSSDDIRYVYDGADLIEEYDASTGNVLRKYVHGPGVDEPVVWYEGADLSDRRWLTADERGSIIASTTAPGGVMNINTYDEYGAPGPNNIGRFGYTGQTWLSEGGIYNYKARAYAPRIGRFMQTDPIGYADNMNPYAYVGNDPANLVDPLGLDSTPNPQPQPPPRYDLTVTGCPAGQYRLPWTGNCGQASVDAFARYMWTLGGGPYFDGGMRMGPGGGSQPSTPIKPSPNKACTALRIQAGKLAESAELLSKSLGGLAAGGGVVAFLGGLGEVESAGADTPVTAAGGIVATYAGGASTAAGGLAASLKSYSAGNVHALGSFAVEFAADRLTGGALKLKAFDKYLPESARTAIEKSLSLAYSIKAIRTSNPCKSE